MPRLVDLGYEARFGESANGTGSRFTIIPKMNSGDPPYANGNGDTGFSAGASGAAYTLPSRVK